MSGDGGILSAQQPLLLVSNPGKSHVDGVVGVNQAINLYGICWGKFKPGFSHLQLYSIYVYPINPRRMKYGIYGHVMHYGLLSMLHP